MAFYSRSFSLPRDESSLDEVVQKFEDVLREQRRKLQRKHRRKVPQNLALGRNLNDGVNGLHLESPPVSPASELSAFTNGGFSCDTASNLPENKETEDNASALQILRRKIAALRARRREGMLLDTANNNGDQTGTDVVDSSRAYSRSTSFTNTIDSSTSDVPGKFVDACLQTHCNTSTVSVGTDSSARTLVETGTTAKPMHTLSLNVLQGVSVPTTPTAAPSKHSIGVSTDNQADLSQTRHIALTRSNSYSRGCDPIIVINVHDAACQTTVEQASKSTKTESKQHKHAEVLCKSVCSTRSVQTESLNNDQTVQVDSGCNTCAKLASSSENASLTGSQNSTSEQLVNEKPEVRPKRPPVPPRPIPRRYSGAPPPNVQSKIIMEESEDEILIYRNPELIQDDSPTDKHRAYLPQIMARREGEREVSCKIESDSASDSDSSDEHEYDVATNTISRAGICRNLNKREPSKEMRAALKVQNDSLQKPELASNPATVRLQLLWAVASTTAFLFRLRALKSLRRNGLR